MLRYINAKFIFNFQKDVVLHNFQRLKLVNLSPVDLMFI